MMFTPEQKQGKCPEYNVMKARCKRDSDCVPGRTLRKGHGELQSSYLLLTWREILDTHAQ